MIEKIKKIFEMELGVITVLLFGSHARGESTPMSDIDIAVLYQRDAIPSKIDLLNLREDLVGALGKDVDLVCLNTASPIIGRQVQKAHQLVLMNDRKAYDKYIMVLFTQYADLKIVRKPIEDAILERRLYGGTFDNGNR